MAMSAQALVRPPAPGPAFPLGGACLQRLELALPRPRRGRLGRLGRVAARRQELLERLLDQRVEGPFVRLGEPLGRGVNAGVDTDAERDRLGGHEMASPW